MQLHLTTRQCTFYKNLRIRGLRRGELCVRCFMASEYAYFNAVGHTKVSSAGLVDELYTRMHIIKLHII